MSLFKKSGLVCGALLGVLLSGCAPTETSSETPVSEPTDTSSEIVGESTSEMVDEPTSETDGHNVLIAYFSCTGHTETVAEAISAHLEDATLQEIVPAVPYTTADLNYNDHNSRASQERADANSRPEIDGTIPNFASYDRILIGHPIWWGSAPRIIQTFLEAYDFEGKRIDTFTTSSSSGGSASLNNLASLYPEYDIVSNFHSTASQISSAATRSADWLGEIGLL